MITASQLLPCGRHGVLVQLDDTQSVEAVAARIRARVEAGEIAFAEVVDVVPAAETVLVTIAGADLHRLRSGLLQLSPVGGSADPVGAAAPEITVEVQYDGPDLDEVARHAELSPAEVVRAHTGTPWRAAFGGFAPGFAYLVGGDDRLRVPRRTSPRASVPPGSVALAGVYSAVYPRSSPGGWQLIGRTDLAVWDSGREPPALLVPGTVVRFVDAGRGGS